MKFGNTSHVGAAVSWVFLFACVADFPPETAAPTSFERVGTYLTGAHPVSGVAIDLDFDGDDDLVVPALITGDIVALINDGDSLSWRQLSPLEVGAGELIAADLDGDSRPELITSNRDDDRVDIYTLVAGPDIELSQTIEVTGATGLAAGDLDGDGDLELVVTCFRDSRIEILDQGSSGLESIASIDTAGGPYAVAIANVGGDSSLEIITTATGDDVVEVFERTDTTSMGYISRATIATAAWPSSLAVADPDEDGVAVVFGAATIGDEVFAISLSPEQATWNMSYAPVTSGDGAFDVAFLKRESGSSALVVSNKEADTASILVTESGQPVPQPVPPQGQSLSEVQVLDTGAGSGPTPVIAWDYDSDGREDLAVVNAFTDEILVFTGFLDR